MKLDFILKLQLIYLMIFKRAEYLNIINRIKQIEKANKIRTDILLKNGEFIVPQRLPIGGMNRVFYFRSNISTMSSNIPEYNCKYKVSTIRTTLQTLEDGTEHKIITKNKVKIP